ncbi:MAG: helicase RepA family protein [Desulfuromonadaceae bacterium]|nr:helicase RepA family protein [Desulfuromonadaceae bacterium]
MTYLPPGYTPDFETDPEGFAVHQAMQLSAPPDDHAAPVKSERRKLAFTDLAETIDSPVIFDWLIDELIEAETTGAIFGASTAGKSFFAVDLAAAVATGGEFLGHRVMKQGPVIYLALEGARGIPRRFKACYAHRGEDYQTGQVFCCSGPLTFDRASTAELIGAIEAASIPPVLIVIDTLARSFAGNENDAGDMMRFINSVDEIRNHFTATMLIIHHTGHGAETSGRARGSSTFRAAMDFEILIDKNANTVTFTKMKDAETPPPMSYRLESHEDSAVFVCDGTASPHAGGPRLSAGEQLGIDTLASIPQPAHLDDWRQAFYARSTADSLDGKRQAFHRARTGLQHKGTITVNDDHYSLSERDNRDTPIPPVTLSRYDSDRDAVTCHAPVTVVTHDDDLLNVDFER